MKGSELRGDQRVGSVNDFFQKYGGVKESVAVFPSDLILGKAKSGSVSDMLVNLSAKGVELNEGDFLRINFPQNVVVLMKAEPSVMTVRPRYAVDFYKDGKFVAENDDLIVEEIEDIFKRL